VSVTTFGTAQGFPPCCTSLEAYVSGLDPQPAYLVLVNRVWQRTGTEMAYQLFALSMRDVLPCIPIPLREGKEEVALDLQWSFTPAYERGPYWRSAVDYGAELVPSLPPDGTQWVSQRLREHQPRS
jgi:hypothetical protein